MNDLAIARILHILGVVLWIGGVAFVTTVLLPTVKQFKSKEERIDFFEKAEIDPEGTYRRIYKMHLHLFILSIITIIGAAAGSHGWLFF